MTQISQDIIKLMQQDPGNLIQPIFCRELVEEGRKDSYWLQVLNEKGKNPSLIGYGLGESKVELFRNPDWKAITIANYNGAVGMDHGDINKNGRDDLVICYQYGNTMSDCDPEGGKIDWLENPAEEGGVWKKHYVGRSVAMHRLKLGYFTQTDKLEILGLPIVGQPHNIHSIAPVKLFQQPEDLANAQSWKEVLVNGEYFHVIHDAAVGKFNQHFNIQPQSPLDSVLIASEEGITWLYYDPDQKVWNMQPVGMGDQSQIHKNTGVESFKGSGNVAFGRLGDDPCAYIACVEPFHGNQVCVYYKVHGGQNDPGWQWKWVRKQLDIYGDPNGNGEGTGHHVVTADFDGDGNDEFIVALRGPVPWKGVHYYKALDNTGAVFYDTKVTQDSAARIALADFSGDGRIDFATMGYFVPGYFEDVNPSIVIFHNRFGPLKQNRPIPQTPPAIQILCRETPNQEIPVPLSKSVPAFWLKNFEKYQVKHKSILINLGNTPTTIETIPSKKILPRSSVIVQNVTLRNVHQVLLIKIDQSLDFGKVILEPGWNQLGEIADFSKQCALFKGRQFDLGEVQFDPKHAVGQSEVQSPENVRRFQLKVNLWYCPSKTDCQLHIVHQRPVDFLEVHTQIYGVGRMQKFHSNNFSSKYEDTILGPGATHLPYAGMNEQGQFIYPWHQYYGDTECIWIANQFHVI